MYETEGCETRFICDRMAGSLCRYLRLMGYDTLSANDLPTGDPKEDTKLLMIARNEARILLTRDAELAQRDSRHTVYLDGESIRSQIQQLMTASLIIPRLRLTRCSLCNSTLIPITPDNLAKLLQKNPDFDYSPAEVSWCPRCMKAYWEGSHTAHIRTRIATMSLKDQD